MINCARCIALSTLIFVPMRLLCMDAVDALQNAILADDVVAVRDAFTHGASPDAVITTPLMCAQEAVYSDVVRLFGGSGVGRQVRPAARKRRRADSQSSDCVP